MNEVPSASHMGGIWDHQICAVHCAMSGILDKNDVQLDDESFRTFLCVCKAMVNTRLVNPDSLSHPDRTDPLTVDHLSTMKSKIVLPPPGMLS